MVFVLKFSGDISGDAPARVKTGLLPPLARRSVQAQLQQPRDDRFVRLRRSLLDAFCQPNDVSEERWDTQVLVKTIISDKPRCIGYHSQHLIL